MNDIKVKEALMALSILNELKNLSSAEKESFPISLLTDSKFYIKYEKYGIRKTKCLLS